MKFFKITLIVLLFIIAIFLGLIAYKSFFSLPNNGLVSFTRGNIAVICVVNEGYSSVIDSKFNWRYQSLPNIEIFKEYVVKNKLNYIFLNDSTLKLSSFESKDKANSFIIEAKRYYNHLLSQIHLEK